jgi:hypothetical protein
MLRTTSKKSNVENNFVEVSTLRCSARNHQSGKWSKKLAGTCLPTYTKKHNIYTRTYGFNMTVTEGINDLGDKAVDWRTQVPLKPLNFLNLCGILPGQTIYSSKTSFNSRESWRQKKSEEPIIHIKVFYT